MEYQTRTECHELMHQLRDDLRDTVNSLKGDMKEGFQEVRRELTAIRAENGSGRKRLQVEVSFASGAISALLLAIIYILLRLIGFKF